MIVFLIIFFFILCTLFVYVRNIINELDKEYKLVLFHCHDSYETEMEYLKKYSPKEYGCINDILNSDIQIPILRIKNIDGKYEYETPTMKDYMNNKAKDTDVVYIEVPGCTVDNGHNNAAIYTVAELKAKKSPICISLYNHVMEHIMKTHGVEF